MRKKMKLNLNLMIKFELRITSLTKKSWKDIFLWGCKNVYVFKMGNVFHGSEHGSLERKLCLLHIYSLHSVMISECNSLSTDPFSGLNTFQYTVHKRTILKRISLVIMYCLICLYKKFLELSHGNNFFFANSKNLV